MEPGRMRGIDLDLVHRTARRVECRLNGRHGPFIQMSARLAVEPAVPDLPQERTPCPYHHQPHSMNGNQSFLPGLPTVGQWSRSSLC